MFSGKMLLGVRVMCASSLFFCNSKPFRTEEREKQTFKINLRKDFGPGRWSDCVIIMWVNEGGSVSKLIISCTANIHEISEMNVESFNVILKIFLTENSY